MDIKINNTEEAKQDASTLISSANTLQSIVSTMETLRNNFIDNWKDTKGKNADRLTIIKYLNENIHYYNNKIIPALNKLGNAINAYAIANEMLASTSESTSSNFADKKVYGEQYVAPTYKKGEEYTVDLTNINYKDTSTTTYMNWNQKWIKGSNQGNFKNKAFEDNNVVCDNDGFYLVNDGVDNRYVVAMTQQYGDVGEYVDVYQADGSVLKCVIGDAKSYNDSNSGQYGHMYGNTVNVLEFMTDWRGNHANPGRVRTSLDQNILKVVNTGKSYNFPKATWK